MNISSTKRETLHFIKKVLYNHLSKECVVVKPNMDNYDDLKDHRELYKIL